MNPSPVTRRLLAGLLLVLAAAGRVLAMENDLFSAATDLGSATSSTIPFQLQGTTRQNGEPTHSASNQGSAWWRWTAPADGELWLGLKGDSDWSTACVYTGETLPTLGLVKSTSGNLLTTPVSSGVTYRIAVTGQSSGTFRHDFFQVPPNDLFADRTHLGSPAAFQLDGWTMRATREAGEPTPTGDSSQGPSVWWSWQAPEDGFVLMDLAGSPEDDWIVGIYTGSTLTGLSARLERPRWWGVDEEGAFRVRAGESLAIVAAADSTGLAGRLRMNWAFTPQPYQDHAAEALDLGSVATAQGSGNNTGATSEANAGGYSTLWWKWTAPVNGLARWKITAPSGTTVDADAFDAAMTLLTGSVMASERPFMCRAGETYFLRMGTPPDKQGPFQYQVSVEPAAGNDDVAEASPLVLGSNPFDTRFSDVEPGEPAINNWYHSLWWDWTAAETGDLILELPPQDYAKLVVYEVAPNGTFSGLVQSPSQLVLRAIPGQRFLIGVAVWIKSPTSMPMGNFQASFIHSATGNDHFANAVDLGSQIHAVISGDPTSSTVEAGEPVHYPATTGRSVWWRWTAPAAGYLGVTGRLPGSAGNGTESGLRVYRGSSLGSLTPAFSAPGNDGNVAAGEVLYFAATQQSNGAVRPVCFEFQFYGANPNDARANAISLGNVTSFEAPLALTGATYESGEPEHSGFGSQSLWWTWTAPAALNVSAGLWQEDWQVAQTDFYEPDGLGGLTRLPGSHLQAVTAGKTYYLSLFSSFSYKGEFRLTTAEPPPGDRRAQPVDLGSAAVMVLTPPPGNGTREAMDPTNIYQSEETFWWSWTAPDAGLFNLGTSDANFWRLQTGNGAGGWIEVAWPLTVASGQQLRIIGLRSTYLGPIDAWFDAFPPNDDRADATDLGSAEDITVTGSVRAAFVEAGEDAWFSQAETPLQGTIWWTWTAPFDGALKAHALVRSQRTAIALLEGAAPQAATLLATARSSATAGKQVVTNVEAGKRYWIMVGSEWARTEGLTTLTLEAWPTAANDSWRHATGLGSLESATAEGTNERALPEPFEPATTLGSVWWKWTAPRTGNATFTCDVLDGDELPAVYRDLSGSDPILVRFDIVRSTGTQKSAGFRAEAGVTYLLSVGVELASNLGKGIRVAIDLADVPLNDDFAGSLALTGPLPISFAGSTISSTTQTSEPLPSTSANGSLWWHWTAPATGRVLATLTGNVVLSVHSGAAVESLTLVRSDGITRWLGWQVQAGTTYRLQVSSYLNGGGGDFSIGLETGSAPPNDLFGNRTSLGSSTTASVSSANFFATAETSEPAHAGTAAGRSIWYTWTAPSAGTYEIDTRASGQEMNVAVYRGTSLTALTAVTSGKSRVSFSATAGQVQVIAIDGAKEAPVSLELRPWSPPANNAFANRTVLTGSSPVIAGDTFGATAETSEPLPFGKSFSTSRTLWWEWTAPANGSVSLPTRVSAAGFVGFQVFWTSNATPAFANLIAVSNTTIFTATAGRRYLIQLVVDSTPTAGSLFRYEGGYYSFPAPATTTPPNDLFADWSAIGSSTGIEITGDVFGSSYEPGQFAPSSAYGTIGWRWTAPNSGWFAVHRDPFSSPHLIRVLRGTVWSSLTTAASGTGENVWFQAAAGESLGIEWQSSYATASDANRPERYVSFQIIGSPGPPANDAFETPGFFLDGLPSFVAGSTVDATAQAGEPAHGGVAATRSVWYQWTATATGPVTVNALSATMRAGIYTGSTLASAVQIASAFEPMEFQAVAGTTYRIALDASSVSDFTVSLRPPAAVAPNDNLADALNLSGSAGSLAGTLRGSTLESAEPHPPSLSPAGSVWWRWTAPANGPVTWHAGSSSIHLAAYLGGTFESLHWVHGGTSTARFHAVAGQTYWIAATGASTTTDFTLSWNQAGNAPANDNFAAAEIIPAVPATLAGTLTGSSRELDEPWYYTSSSREHSVWYAWTAAASGPFRLELQAADPADIWIFQGDGLTSLFALAGATRAVDFNATAGATYHIALVAKDAAEVTDFQLRLFAHDYGSNDAFADRISLGNTLPLRWEGTAEGATREPGEPDPNQTSSFNGTRWWSWTAPADGALVVDVIEPENIVVIAAYTGDSLPELREIDSSPTESGSFAFPVAAGTTYSIQVEAYSYDFVVEFSFAELAHDRFEDPLLLGASLPVSSEIPATGASNQTGESTVSRSVWWRWTAAADGWVDVDLRASDFTATAWVGRGSSLPHLTPVSLTPAGTGIWRFFATAGTTYRIASGSSSETSFGKVRLTLSLAQNGPANDAFAGALVLAGDATGSSSSSRGATVETNEVFHLGGSHSRSLWWKWTAPRSGVLLLSGTATWWNVYQGTSIPSLTKLPLLSGFSGIHAVTEGQTYLIAAGHFSGGDFQMSLTLSPPGDLFAQAVVLPGSRNVQLPTSLTGCFFEAQEPYHADRPAARSRWYRWIAPASGSYRIEANTGGIPLRLSAYTGTAIHALTRQASGTSLLFLSAVAGSEYRIAVDASSQGSGGDFILSIAPEPAAYASWRDSHFSASDPNSGPDDDPDGDGRTNLIELGLGSDPRAGNAEPPFTFTTTSGPIHLKVRRPTGLDDWWHSFDLAPQLTGWQSSDAVAHTRWIEAHGDGTETLHVVLTDYLAEDHPQFFFRLRIEEAP